MRLLSLCLLLTAPFLSSHELQKFNLSIDFLEADQSKEIEMDIKVPRNLYRPSLEETINNGFNFNACNEKDFDLINSSARYLTFKKKITCNNFPSLLEARNFFSLYPDQTILVNIKKGTSLQNQTFLNNSKSKIDFKETDRNFSFFSLGLNHFLGGYDHIAFVSLLTLLIIGIKQLIYLLSGFTLGHAISITFSSLGFISVKISIIEILIGYSIFLLALEYLVLRQVNKNRMMKINFIFWISLVCLSLVFLPEITVLSLGMALIGISYPYLITRNSLIRIVATVFFGLIHGFGFASNLSNFDSQSLISSIILFNLGIEAAQILYAFLLLLTLYLIAKTRLISRLFLKDLISLVVFFFSTLWFIGRLLF